MTNKIYSMPNSDKWYYLNLNCPWENYVNLISLSTDDNYYELKTKLKYYVLIEEEDTIKLIKFIYSLEST